MCTQVNIAHLQIICHLRTHSFLEIYGRPWVLITVLYLVTFKGNEKQITPYSTCTCQELATLPATRQMNTVVTSCLKE